MNELRPFLIRMSGFLVIVVAICGALYSTLIEAFLANPALNGLIIGVLIIGIVFAFRQVLRAPISRAIRCSARRACWLRSPP